MKVISKQFKYVLALAREGSFSRAADALNISQPSLSQYIKKIETQLEVELFDRSGGNVRLTDAGQIYVEFGRKILDLEHQMDSRFQDIIGCQRGSIRIGISAHRSVGLMPPVVKAFKAEYPGYQLFLDERSRNVLIDAAEHGEFDLCITTLPVDRDTFHVEPLFREEMVLAVPADSDICRELNSEGSKVDIEMVDGADFVVLREEHPMQAELEAMLSKYDLSINRTVECTSLETMLSMVSAGMGMALMPISLKSRGSSNVAFFSLKQEIHRRDIVVIYRKEQHLNSAMLRLKELMKQLITEQQFQ